MAGKFRMLRSVISGVQAVEAETHHSFARHTHEQFGIGLIHGGAQKSLSGRGMVEAEAGDLITVNPNEVHDGTPIGEARSWRILYFDPDVIAKLSLELAARSEIPRPVIRDGDLARRFARLFTAIGGEEKGQGLLQEELLVDVVADVMAELPVAGQEYGIPGEVRHARARIDDDPASNVSLADLAQESGLSRFQILRAFSRATGMTPHAYLVQKRIDLARRLIARGTALAEAALASGFADQSHMTRVFVARYGFSPRVYAKAFA